MDKRYQIFVSSTFSDLQEERQAVMQALLSLDHFPAGMELFPASDEDQWALIKGVIDDSDYYVLVVGGRYGSTTTEGISYTEMEFEYAKSSKKPILAFVHQNPDLIPAGKTELSDSARAKLHTFRTKVQTGRHVKFWGNADDLRAKVIQSISAETKRNPQEGWIRAGRAADPAEMEGLRKEIDKLRAELAAAKSEAPPGADSYAGGTDAFEVTIQSTSQRNGSWERNLHGISVSWNNIFFELGPTLMEEATEQQMKLRLSNELWRYDIELSNLPDNTRYSIRDDSFDTIKIQLLALGLIQKSQKKHVPSDTNRYWSLTSYGETTLMTLRAIPKDDANILLSRPSSPNQDSSSLLARE
ncbi:DUF4062 domain-containing protein [Bradyrhizobium sp. 83012]|uniref:DUF4062 domain-containing protein n=1 Tax=Bradyrhizobium aeschynomenes TaxID=2734909 RepID=A0ABX2CCT9_9BRAD|nr:DUF4062 domain-containing protein [Bradyrhizobium aeschynomenes]NPU66044.1 DUF4062 domain-containing protein [Bradyrhizobium aeschynomenes]